MQPCKTIRGSKHHAPHDGLQERLQVSKGDVTGDGWQKSINDTIPNVQGRRQLLGLGKFIAQQLVMGQLHLIHNESDGRDGLTERQSATT